MTQEDIITDLSAHLRREGVHFVPEDLEAFAADVRREPAIDRDIEALARRFRDSRGAAARARRRKRVRAWLEGWCVAGIGFVLLGLATIFWLYCLGDPHGFHLFISPFGILFDCVGLLGAYLLVRGFAGAVLTSHRLAAEAERDES